MVPGGPVDERAYLLAAIGVTAPVASDQGRRA